MTSRVRFSRDELLQALFDFLVKKGLVSLGSYELRASFDKDGADLEYERKDKSNEASKKPGAERP